MFPLFTTFTFEPGTYAENEHLKLSKGCRKDAMLFRLCPEWCFAIDFLHNPGEITKTFTLVYPGALLGICSMFRGFLALMKSGGHRNTLEGFLCAGL